MVQGFVNTGVSEVVEQWPFGMVVGPLDAVMENDAPSLVSRFFPPNASSKEQEIGDAVQVRLHLLIMLLHKLCWEHGVAPQDWQLHWLLC